MLLGFSGSHAGAYAGAFLSGHHPLDPPGASGPPIEYQPGLGPYEQVDGNGVNRWGDYSLTCVDPVDDVTFWTIQEFARPNNGWSTRIAEAAFLDPCPSTWSTCTGFPNSTGAAAGIASSGGTSVAADDLTLTAFGAPASQNGIFFYGSQETFVPFGDGVLCVTGGVQRLPVVTTDAFGTVDFDLDLSAPPSPAGQITAGSTWFFQFWYRDPAAGASGFNLSNALGATFCP